MLRRILILGVLALLLAAPAQAAQRRLLMPGVLYEKEVAFTSRGPVVVHVLTAPKPGGLHSLKPVLSNGQIQGLQTVTSMQRDVSSIATVAGVNGDLFNRNDGHPTGGLIRDGVVEHRFSPDRSTIGIDSVGNLRVERVTLFGTWQGSGQRRPLLAINAPPGANGISLYTPVWGATTPTAPGAQEVVISPLPPTVANVEVSGPVVATGQGGGTTIPPGGGVLVARGTQALRLGPEARVGQTVALRLILKPDWSEVVDALGGGPLIVREGKPVFRSAEVFAPEQLLPRNPRTAVGQRADGRIILLAVDGRQPGYSVGMTNFELAQTLARLGAVTGSALDSGGSTTMAFDGQLLNRPSDPSGERAVSNAVLIFYAGVYAPPPLVAAMSPNGDGVDERQQLSYKLVRPAVVKVSLVGPNGVDRFTDSGPKDPGTYQVPFTGRTSAGAPDVQGRYRLAISATDDLRRTSSVARAFTVNNTLGFLTPERRLLAVPRARPRAIATVSLTNAATISAAVETGTGAPLATVLSGRRQPVRLTLEWDGRNRNGSFVYPGRYFLRVKATNVLGSVELTAPIGVRVLAKPKRPRD
ncbi:MAG: phosphodiester glycosidase family protein [Gaiellaceae bacterium]